MILSHGEIEVGIFIIIIIIIIIINERRRGGEKNTVAVEKLSVATLDALQLFKSILHLPVQFICLHICIAFLNPDREIVCFKPEHLLFWCAYGLYIIIG